MNEVEWLTGTDFTAHARCAAERLSPRRQRLLAVAFCRAVGELLDHPDLTDALDVIERYADGFVPAVMVERARQECREVAQFAYESYVRQIDGGHPGDTDAGALQSWVRHELAWAVANAASTPLSLEGVGGRAATAAVQARTGIIYVMPIATADLDRATTAQNLLMRAVVWEVVGNPFREPHFSPEWRTDTALAVARQMYEARDFSAMPILADALQDAGCDNEELLAHCRGETGGGYPAQGAHVRGCWALDLVLGR